jgi:hypothetical protein
MAAWQARLNCAVCGHKRDTGIHLPALTGPRKGLPWGHEFKPIGPSNSADAPRPTRLIRAADGNISHHKD